jgi:hypothetical protein
MIEKFSTYKIQNATNITGGSETEENSTEVRVNKAKMADKAMN